MRGPLKILHFENCVLDFHFIQQYLILIYFLLHITQLIVHSNYIF